MSAEALVGGWCQQHFSRKLRLNDQKVKYTVTPQDRWRHCCCDIFICDLNSWFGSAIYLLLKRSQGPSVMQYNTFFFLRSTALYSLGYLLCIGDLWRSVIQVMVKINWEKKVDFFATVWTLCHVSLLHFYWTDTLFLLSLSHLLLFAGIVRAICNDPLRWCYVSIHWSFMTELSSGLFRRAQWWCFACSTHTLAFILLYHIYLGKWGLLNAPQPKQDHPKEHAEFD